MGLLSETGRTLGLRKEMVAYARENAQLPLVQRFFGALREVALDQLTAPLILLVDEIDATRNLSFSTDEFFAAVRECYNSRTLDPTYRRLTFCLLGVASPSDLIQNPLMSPFNIGRRISLQRRLPPCLGACREANLSLTASSIGQAGIPT
jgi:hypothetical protein